MTRTRLPWTVALASLLLLIASRAASLAAADDEPVKPAPPAEPAKPPKPVLPWLTSWAAGREAAREKKGLVFVYVAQDKPPSERCKWLEDTVFGDPRAPEIAARCVLVRLKAGDDITPEVRDFNLRYGVEAFPAMYVLNAAGHLVVVPGMDASVDSVLTALMFAEREEEDFAKYSVGKTDEERKRLRESLEHRMAWEEVVQYHEDDARRRSSPATLTRLATTYRRMGKVASERATLAMAIDLFEEDPLRTRWRIRLATMPLDEIVGDAAKFHHGTVERLTPLAQQFGRESDRASEAEVRYAIALARAELHECAEAKAEFEEVVRLAPRLASAPKALLGLAAVCWYEYDYDGCRAACARILEDYRGTAEAKSAAHTIKSCDEKSPPK